MTMKSMTIGSMAVLMAVPLLAGTFPELQRLEQAVKYDQSVVANAGRGQRPQYAEIERQQALKNLASDQAALDAFKTMGPSNWRQAQLEKAISEDQAALAQPNRGEHFTVVKARREAALKRLATDQAALESFKTMGPTNWEIAQHEQGVKDAQAALRYAYTGGKMVEVQQRQEAARRDLTEHQAAIEALKGQ